LPTTSEDDEDDAENDRVRERSTSKTKPVLKRDELTTVNMDELTDLFSKPKVYFAKKSHPDENSILPDANSPTKTAAKQSPPVS
jgi:hypothetical protein